jgi:hypothetical protein
MIRSEAELAQSIEQMARMYRALSALREEVRPGSEQHFRVLAEGPLEELRRLEADVHEFSGRVAAEEQGADVWLRIVGSEIIWPDAPTSVLTNFLDTFRKGVQAAAEWISFRTLSARPTKALKQACDLLVVGLQPGSLRVGVRLPEIPDNATAQPAIPEATVQEALAKYLTMAEWACSTREPAELSGGVEDSELRRILLTYVKQLAPRPRGAVDLVELSGRAMPRHQPVQLTREVHRRIDAAIDAAVTEQVERHEGEVREIDLDSHTFKLRRVGGDLFQVDCEFEPDLYDSAVAALDRRVEVTGIRRMEAARGHSGRLKVTRLVILEEYDEPPERES